MRVETIVALLFLVWAPAAQGQPIPTDRVDAYFREFERAGQFSGTVLIAQNDRIVFERAYGGTGRQGLSFSADTHFPIASLSKAFTAAAIVNLARQGRLGFDDPLSRFLPSFPNGGAIKVDQLLRHASGVGVIDEPEYFLRPHSLNDLVTAIGRARPLFTPGAGDEYSNEGYVLLAAIIEQASGTTFRAYMEQTFWRPLALRETGFDRPDRRRAAGSRAILDGRPQALSRDEVGLPGASGLQSSARDILRWMQALQSGRYGDYSALRYPYGWGRRTYSNQRLIEQSGSVEGFGSYMAAYENGRFVVILANLQSAMQASWGPDVAAILSGDTPSHPLALVADRSRTALSGLAGRYENPSGGYPLHIRLARGQLEMTWGSYPFWRPVTLLHGGDLIAMADNTRMRPERDSSGRVVALLLVAADGSASDPPRFVRR